MLSIYRWRKGLIYLVRQVIKVIWLIIDEDKILFCITLSPQSNSFSEYLGSENFINLLIESSTTPHFQKNLNGHTLKSWSFLALQLLTYNSFIIILKVDKCVNISFPIGSNLQTLFFLVNLTFHTYTSLNIIGCPKWPAKSLDLTDAPRSASSNLLTTLSFHNVFLAFIILPPLSPTSLTFLLSPLLFCLVLSHPIFTF